MPLEFPLDRTKLRAVFNTILSEGHDVLTESTSKALLEAYEIPVSKPYVARCPDDAVRIANRIGYPVAMKIISYDITHKTDVGGVALHLANDETVAATYQNMMQSVRASCPDARVEGVTIQQMVGHPGGLELILGRNATLLLERC